jgi:tRNA (cytidine/uridine-2'-O-)-methyltransferase
VPNGGEIAYGAAVFHVILHQPQIPPNTGNIIRLCANTGCQLHLVAPLGFDLDRRSVRRAGLDYAELTLVRQHASLEQCLLALAPSRLFAIETGHSRHYSAARFEPGDALMFGSETNGLPGSVLATLEPARHLSIPMRAGNRSLNLSNAVAVVVYEAWRQQGFEAGATLAAGHGEPPR